MKNYYEMISEINGNKNLKNDFGGFNYRNAEEMLTDIKPLLIKYGFDLSVTNDIMEIGDKPIIKTIVTLTNTEGESKTATSFVGIDDDRKGMNTPQLWGASLSYCLKYSLCNLFLISPEKNDADSNAYTEATGQYNVALTSQKPTKAKNELGLTDEQLDATRDYLTNNPQALSYYNVKYGHQYTEGRWFNVKEKSEIYNELKMHGKIA